MATVRINLTPGDWTKISDISVKGWAQNPCRDEVFFFAEMDDNDTPPAFSPGDGHPRTFEHGMVMDGTKSLWCWCHEHVVAQQARVIFTPDGVPTE